MDAPIPTKEEPGPFDGMENAKPGEPVFTLQGGDPLAAPLVQLWADCARVRAGVGSADCLAPDFAKLAGVATREKAGRHKQEELKLRATEAESIGWEMDAYRKGEKFVEQETESYSGHRESEESKEKAAKTRSLHELAHNLEEAKHYVHETADALEGIEEFAHMAGALRANYEQINAIATTIRPWRRADHPEGWRDNA
jgi:hypothetical protein